MPPEMLLWGFTETDIFFSDQWRIAPTSGCYRGRLRHSLENRQGTALYPRSARNIEDARTSQDPPGAVKKPVTYSEARHGCNQDRSVPSQRSQLSPPPLQPPQKQRSAIQVLFGRRAHVPITASLRTEAREATADACNPETLALTPLGLGSGGGRRQKRVRSRATLSRVRRGWIGK